MEAVSYTHLDVYKRQAVMFAKKINKDIDVELMKSELQQSLPTYEITVRGRNVRFYSCLLYTSQPAASILER